MENAYLSYKIQELEIEKNVTSQFYQVYKNQKSLDIARDEYENQKQNYEIIKNKVANGLIAAEELFQAEVNLATGESAVYSAEITYENLKDNFKLLIGMPLDSEFSALPNIHIVPLQVNLGDAIRHGLAVQLASYS